MGIVLAILLFSFIVIVHELGHFLLAKANGIEVFEFSLGMGPTLLKKEIGGTVYCLKLLPLGGSCMMGEDDYGEEEVSSEEMFDQKSGGGAESYHKNSQEESKEQYLGSQDRKGNFNEKSVWARMSVIAGGPAFNFLLAWIFATIMVMWIGFGSSQIGAVVEGSGAWEAGLQEGDLITEMNGRNIYLWSEISVYNQFHPGETVEIEFIRDGETCTTIVEPQYDEESGGYLLGVVSSGYQTGNILESMQYGAYTVRYWIYTVIDSLKMLVSGSVSMNEMSGPVGITSIIGETYEESSNYGWDVVILNMMNLIVLLSANLGVMNLLPIPALDGGRLVFLIVEAIRGKRVSPEREGMVHFIGFALLMILMIVILFNDILKLI